MLARGLLTSLILLPLLHSVVQADESDLYRLQRGVFYYHYLNDDYQQALSSLARLRALGQPLDAEPQLMEAAIMLALGLTDDAARLFSEASGGQASADAWFYLARAWAEQGRWQDCELSATKALAAGAASPLNAQYSEEARYLLVSAIAHQDRINDAVDQLALMPDTSIWTAYARYNLLIARMRLYTPGRDIARLVEAAVYYAPKDYEGQALRDRILLTAGVYNLETGKPKEAEQYLGQMSQDGPFSAPGLLQYGWSLVDQWHYEEALQPWRVLQQRFQPFHPAVMESILGVPHALELLNATTQSLKTYELVEGRLQGMLDHLQEQNKPAQIQAWLSQWLSMQDSEWGWQRTHISDMPDTPLSSTLQALLDDPQFTRSAFRLHELTAMLQHNQQQLDDMALWADVLQKRQQALRSLDGKRRLQALDQRQQQLTAQVAALSGRLQQEDDKVFAFASVSDQGNVSRLQHVVPRVEYLRKIATPTRDLAGYQERWRRARGLQLWRIYENRPQRQWSSAQAFWQLQADIANLYEQLANTRTALQWADSSWQGFPQRVSAMQQRLQQQRQQLLALQQQQNNAVQQQVTDYMNALTVRITDYLAQARLSVARLYDDALQQNIADAAVPEVSGPENDSEANEPDTPEAESELPAAESGSETPAAAEPEQKEVAGE